MNIVLCNVWCVVGGVGVAGTEVELKEHLTDAEVERVAAQLHSTTCRKLTLFGDPSDSMFLCRSSSSCPWFRFLHRWPAATCRHEAFRRGGMSSSVGGAAPQHDPSHARYSM
jgi:hypothetical protein